MGDKLINFSRKAQAIALFKHKQMSKDDIMARCPKCLREWLECLASGSMLQSVLQSLFCTMHFLCMPGIAMMVLNSDDERCDFGAIVKVRCILSLCQCSLFVVAGLAVAVNWLADDCGCYRGREEEIPGVGVCFHAHQSELMDKRIAKCFRPVMLLFPPVEYGFGFGTWAEVSECDLSSDGWKNRNAGGRSWNPLMLVDLGLYVGFWIFFFSRRYKMAREQSADEQKSPAPPTHVEASV